MSPSRRRRELLAALCAAPAAWLGATSPAQAQAFVPEEGRHYQALERRQPTESPRRVEVLDFFWYGCPHCYNFLPDLEAWRKRQPADVAFKHSPIDFGDAAREPHARIFFALQALGRAEELHVKVFEAFHVQHRRLTDPGDIADFMAANGIPRDRWLEAFNSFSTANQVRRARQTADAYGVDGTPMIGVGGRYLTAPSMLADLSNPSRATLATIDYLVDRLRRERQPSTS